MVRFLSIATKDAINQIFERFLVCGEFGKSRNRPPCRQQKSHTRSRTQRRCLIYSDRNRPSPKWQPNPKARGPKMSSENSRRRASPVRSGWSSPRRLRKRWNVSTLRNCPRTLILPRNIGSAGFPHLSDECRLAGPAGLHDQHQRGVRKGFLRPPLYKPVEHATFPNLGRLELSIR
jgi:hypothetical protein